MPNDLIDLNKLKMPQELLDTCAALTLLIEQNKRLRGALRFYANPGREIPGAEWRGGVRFCEGGSVYLDQGDIARRALRWRPK